MSKKEPFYILALDGGGTRGIYAARILECLEESLKVQIRDCFNLIAGTSTGSIIAGAAAIGIPMKNVVELFEREGPKIFRRKLHRFSWFSSKYSKKPLERAIDNHLSSTIKLGEISTPLMIMSSDISAGDVWVFKSKYMEEEGHPYSRDKGLLLKDAILSSCAAPTFFAPQGVYDSLRGSNALVVDGGLWANNPSIFAYTEALSKFNNKVDVDQIKILSIGTAPETSEMYSKKRFWGFLTGWGREKFIHYILGIQSRASTNMAGLLLGDRQYLRIQPKKGSWDLDSTGKKHFNRLKEHADNHFAENESKIKAEFTKSSTSNTKP